MRRMFQTYLTQYLRALEDNEEEEDEEIDANQMFDEENGGDDNMSDDDDDDDDSDEETLQRIVISRGGGRTSSRLSTRSAQSRLREEEKEKQFQDKLSELLKALNEHDIAQTIRAHTGQYCKNPNSDPVEKIDKINFYSGVNYTQKKGLIYQLHRRKIGNCTNGALHRSAALTSPSDLSSIASRFLPSLNRGPIGKSDAYMFCGQFSLDGKFFMSASQDQVIRIYDVNTILLKKSSISTRSKPTNESQTSRMEDDDVWSDSDEDDSPRDGLNDQTGFGNNSTVKHIREIHARDVGWSIIDCNPSPDNRLLVYSSWSPYIHLATFAPQDYDPNENIEKRLKYIEKHEQLYLNPGNYRFCAFAVRFSPDGKEILAGSNDDHLYIYDLEKNVRTERIHAHKSDINTVCYAGPACPNLFYSGSDDGLCKVWDRRQCSTSSSTPVGVLAGHSDGITCVSSKGDGRYFISNGKDQTCKLWDIRKMADSAPQIPRASNLWDYRYEAAPSRHARVIHPHDQSIMTYTGHHVLQTLIRCYFSPMSTGQQYIYSGSHDGIVYIFDILTGQIVKRLYGHSHIVRDVNWHPYLPVLFSSSWDGTCLMWSHNNLN